MTIQNALHIPSQAHRDRVIFATPDGQIVFGHNPMGAYVLNATRSVAYVSDRLRLCTRRSGFALAPAGSAFYGPEAAARPLYVRLGKVCRRVR